MMIKISCRFILGLCLLILPLPAQAGMRAMRIERHLDDLKRILEKMPYTSEGEGPVIYILENPESLPCRKFSLTFSGKDLGIELRHILIAESTYTADAAAHLATTRKISDYRALMDRTLVAPSYRTSDQTRAGLDAIMDPIRDWVLPIMKKNGYMLYGIEAPIFFWEQLGVFFMEEGYEIERFHTIMESAKVKLEDYRVRPEEILLIDNQLLILPPLVEGDAPTETQGQPSVPAPLEVPGAEVLPIADPATDDYE